MDRVKFLKDVSNNTIQYKANSLHEIISEDKENYFVRQPDCPKNKNWATMFSKKCEDDLFVVL